MSVTIGAATLHLGDCLHVLRTMPDNSVDSIVTDPPYGLSFMGKKWDYDVPAVEVWAECLRVLKPGGHLLAFAGTRTQHRMAVRIEDAGFEIRDMIAWVYGSGFPKSMDVSKAIDKAAGMERERVRTSNSHAGSNVYAQDKWTKENAGTRLVNDPITEAARQWQGWGTALKPALEPITMARKPLSGTVAANVLQHGTGGINVDGCRVEWASMEDAAAAAAAVGFADSRARGTSKQSLSIGKESRDGINRYEPDKLTGRWPANLIHDGSDEVAGMFPQTTSGGGNGSRSESSNTCMSGKNYARTTTDGQPPSSGSAARFFYTSKAAPSDRQEGNTHPTVKPTDLMQYLCRLVTPPGGVVLDPFMGSGSTGKAALIEGFAFLGIEREPQYFDIAQNRIRHAACADGLFAEAI